MVVYAVFIVTVGSEPEDTWIDFDLFKNRLLKQRRSLVGWLSWKKKFGEHDCYQEQLNDIVFIFKVKMDGSLNTIAARHHLVGRTQSAQGGTANKEAIHVKRIYMEMSAADARYYTVYWLARRLCVWVEHSIHFDRAGKIQQRCSMV